MTAPIFLDDGSIRDFVYSCRRLNKLLEDNHDIRPQVIDILENYRNLHPHNDGAEREIFFCLAALTDEIFINKDISWVNDTMEYKFFSTNDAGTVILNNIDNIIKKREKTIVTYIYLVLLGYGFKGSSKFVGENQQRFSALVNLLEILDTKDHFFNTTAANYNAYSLSSPVYIKDYKRYIMILPVIFLLIYLCIWTALATRMNWLLSFS